MYTNAGCSRLVDYYFVVSCDDRGIAHIKNKLQKKSLAPANETEARHAQFALKPKIIERYPETNHVDTPLLPWVARTAMPRGIRARTRPPPPTFYSFVGWNTDSSKLYAACLLLFEKVEIENQLQTVYVPKTLGFISHYPYFCAFEVFLHGLYLWHVNAKKLIPVEQLLVHYFYDIPAPTPGSKHKYKIEHTQVLLACRNEFDIPILELPMETVFTRLSKDRICFILKLLLLEKRVMFICGDMHQLTPVCEVFVSLLFPLRWRHLYLPLLSHTMFQALTQKYAPSEHRPTLNKYTNTSHSSDCRYPEEAPFLVGLPRFAYLNPEFKNNLPRNSYLVFLDKNEITDEHRNRILPKEMRSGQLLPNLPSTLEKSLQDAVHSLARILTMHVDDILQQSTHHSSARSARTVLAPRYVNKYSNPNDDDDADDDIPQFARSSAANHSYSSVISTASTAMTIGTHNSMAISREFTLQAFRKMFAVLTKLLFLSAHQKYGNSASRHSYDHEQKEATSKDKYAKSAKGDFVVMFRGTVAFQSFYRYYKRINGDNDPDFKRLYLFYKRCEGNGKYFARRQILTWPWETDGTLYDKPIFKLNQKEILALEQHEIALKSSRKLKFPSVEFEMLDEEKQFLAKYVWRESRHKQTGSGHTHSLRSEHSVYSSSIYTPRSVTSGAFHDDHSHAQTPLSPVISQKSDNSRKYPRRKRRTSKHGTYGMVYVGDEYSARVTPKSAPSGNLTDIHYRQHNIVPMANVNHITHRYPKPPTITPQKTDQSDSGPSSHDANSHEPNTLLLKGASSASMNNLMSMSPVSAASSDVLRRKLHHTESSRRGSKASTLSNKSKKSRSRKSPRFAVADQPTLAKIGKFVQDMNQHKDDEAKQLALCLEIEKTLQDEIAITSSTEKTKDVHERTSEYWQGAVYEALQTENETRQSFVSMIQQTCGNSPGQKSRLTLLREVVKLLDDDLSVAGSVPSDLLQKHESTNSEATGSQDDDWTDDSDEDASEEDEHKETTSQKKKKQKKGLIDGKSESVLEEHWASSSSSCNTDIGDDDETDQKHPSESAVHNNFSKLDEFNVEKTVLAYMDEREILHNHLLGQDGSQYLNKTIEHMVGVDFFTQHLIEKWTKHQLKLQLLVSQTSDTMMADCEAMEDSYQRATAPISGPSIGLRTHAQSYANQPMHLALSASHNVSPGRSLRSSYQSGADRQRRHQIGSRSLSPNAVRSKPEKSDSKSPKSARAARSVRFSSKSPPAAKSAKPQLCLEPGKQKKKRSRSKPKENKQQRQHVQISAVSPNVPPRAHSQSYAHSAKYHQDENHDAQMVYQQRNIQPHLVVSGRNNRNAPRNGYHKNSPRNGHTHGHHRKKPHDVKPYYHHNDDV